MREGCVDADGTEKRWTDDEIQSMLAEERAQMDEECGRKDEEVMGKVMGAYDRLHSRSTLFNGTTVELFRMRLDE